MTNTTSPHLPFEEAYMRLKEIHDQIQGSGFIAVDELIKLQEEAQKCADSCQRILSKYNTDAPTQE